MLKPKQSPVTMRDVAALAGVSKHTVSAVLNGKPGITAETQVRNKRRIKMVNAAISRRAFLKAVGAVSVGTTISGALAACQPAGAPAASSGEPGAAPKQLVTYWGGWTPSEDMTKSEDNPTPHDNLTEVLAAYMAQKPGVEVEWIRVPQGMDSREWTIAQQTAGTIPHIVPQGTWHTKDDTDKNWWVDLTPHLEKPNAYITDGAEGSKRWLDQFYPIPTGETLIQGKYYNLVYGLVTTFFYYNVDWFKQLGLTAPETYAQFLEVCAAFKEEGVNAYGGWTGSVADTDHWYRIQLGGMLMSKDIEPLVNPDSNTATFDEVACAIKTGVYSPRLPQYREWMELWKQNVPYRTPDWPTQATDSHANFLKKVEPIMENGTWSLARLQSDSLMDFEWGAFFAPTLTKESSQFVSDPPTSAWPIGGAVGDQFSLSMRSETDGLLDVALDLMQWISVPENLNTIQSEIGETIPNIKNVKVKDSFKDSYEKLTSKIGESQMFSYEQVKMDDEASTPIGQAWRAYMLDQMDIEEALTIVEESFNSYADRYMKKTGLTCG